ncbi:SAF domain-containing protein [Microbacterium halophytorum]|uniref:SAF domain-containing protein n=1 Tax=Microbacterium halophytorum TaxID=2067568 RepID=UPI000CFAF539|nr:SAF domain-containing protein [Microbacterium halophytorum]
MTKRRAFWADARFSIGIGMIIVSVVGVWAVVTGARQTSPVFVAQGTIVAGEEIAPGDVAVVEAQLGSAAERYLGAAEPLDGLVAQRTIASGELVPASALGEATDTTTVVVDSAAEVPASVTTGTPVELWSAPATEDGFDAPRILVPDAVVGAVTRDESVMAARGASIELVVGRADVADVLGAISSGAALSVVPSGGAR